jgi:pyruvate formate lyase activating enzyme
MREALLWEPEGAAGAARCGLCAHRCRVNPGKYGACHVRYNDGGALRTLVYGRAIAERVDPVEKKPLYHFLPASGTYSIATAGCNFGCRFCQNWSISQAFGLRDGDAERGGAALEPGQAVRHALKSGCRSVSFTYTEPTVFFEYALDTAKLAAGEGLKTVFVSNGYMTPECLRAIGPYLSACNIDLKSFRDDFYRKFCGASLGPVLESLKAIRAMGIWLEVTTLVISGENDSDGELSDIAGFIAAELGADVPWHVSRFFPQYRMAGRAPSDISSVKRAEGIGRAAGLRYVYAGNVDFAQDTACPSCGGTVIRRRGYRADVSGLDAGVGGCRRCGAKISGIFC